MNEVTPQTVYADFNNHNGRYLLLSCDGTKADLKKRGIVLREGLVLRVSDGDLAATGTVKWSPEFAPERTSRSHQAVSFLRFKRLVRSTEVATGGRE